MADEPLFDAIERKQLADLFDELGPDAPTLLDPWTTRDLAAHLCSASRTTSRHQGSSCPVCVGPLRRTTTNSTRA
jgi:hypothetical protein